MGREAWFIIAFLFIFFLIEFNNYLNFHKKENDFLREQCGTFYIHKNISYNNEIIHEVEK